MRRAEGEIRSRWILFAVFYCSIDFLRIYIAFSLSFSLFLNRFHHFTRSTETEFDRLELTARDKLVRIDVISANRKKVDRDVNSFY